MSDIRGLRVLIVDDSPIFCAGLEHVLAARGANVVGTALDAVAATIEIPRTHPDLVILDVRMPPSHTNEGLLAASQIRRNHPRVGLLVLSQDAQAHHVERLMTDIRRGIGYLLKDRVTDIDDFVAALRVIADGGTVVDPLVINLMVAVRAAAGDDPLRDLSVREQTVLSLMAEGLTNIAIADRLGIGHRTVETHVKSVFTKLGLSARPEEDRRVRAVIAYLQAAPGAARRAPD